MKALTGISYFFVSTLGNKKLSFLLSIIVCKFFDAGVPVTAFCFRTILRRLSEAIIESPAFLLLSDVLCYAEVA